MASYSGMVIIIDFHQCLRERRILKVRPSPPMIEKELKAARIDLEIAEDNHSRGYVKWSSVQAYYSMFHSAKALVLSKGYREKGHWCLLIALRELYVKTGEMDEELADDLELAMGVRHDADYELEYDEITSGRVIKKARAMLTVTNDLLEQR